MMFNILKLLEIFTISDRFEVSLMRLQQFLVGSRGRQDARCSARSLCERLASVATATLSVTSRHDDHDLSPKNLRALAISL